MSSELPTRLAIDLESKFFQDGAHKSNLCSAIFAKLEFAFVKGNITSVASTTEEPNFNRTPLFINHQ